MATKKNTEAPKRPAAIKPTNTETEVESTANPTDTASEESGAYPPGAAPRDETVVDAITYQGDPNLWKTISSAETPDWRKETTVLRLKNGFVLKCSLEHRVGSEVIFANETLTYVPGGRLDTQIDEEGKESHKIY